MANDVVRLDDRRAVAITPAAEQALRLIAYSVRAGDDDAEVRRWITPAIADAITVRVAQAAAALTPATMGDARRFLGPTLSLVAPVSMTADDQATWLAAALDTLSGIPADLLEAGCRAARRTADHPAKILPAIFASIGAPWERRKLDRATTLRMDRIARLPPPSAPDIATPEQAAEALGNLSAYSAADRAPRPQATVADYLAHGMTEAEALELVAQATAGLAGRRA